MLFVEGSELFACGRLSIAVNWLRPQGKGLAEISRSELPIAFGLVNKASDGVGQDKLGLEIARSRSARAMSPRFLYKRAEVEFTLIP